MRHKVILDTNVWVSYFINARAHYLINWILSNNIEVFTTNKLIDELKDVLYRPKFKKQFPFPVEEFINLHLSVCTRVKISSKYQGSPDNNDDFLFDLALKTDADFLITSDKLLLNFIPGMDLQIMTFFKFRELF